MEFINECNCIVDYTILEKAISEECSRRNIISRTDITKEKAVDLHEKGFTISDIAKKLNCGYNTVYKRLGMKD